MIAAIYARWGKSILPPVLCWLLAFPDTVDPHQPKAK